MIGTKNSSPFTGAFEYITSQQIDGVFPEFPQMTRGPSDAWTTACVASALFEMTQNPNLPQIIKSCDTLLKLRQKDGGWSYNTTVRSDPDSTARVIQFFQKIGYYNFEIFNEAFAFIMSHQDRKTGGIMTYTPDNLTEIRKLDKSRGYPGGGWDQSHACVSAVVHKVLPDKYPGKDKLLSFLLQNPEPYWWIVGHDGEYKPFTNYVSYETQKHLHRVMTPPGEDVVDKGLAILGSRGNTRYDVLHLLRLQNSDGSFPPSHTFHLPESDSPVGTIPSPPRIMADKNRLFATATVGVVLKRLEI